MHTIEVEIERNYAAFKELIGSLLPKEEGRYALMHKQELVGLFDTAGAAEIAGYKAFGDKPYSIQEVDPQPLDLGFFSHALPSR